ncbi:MAG TPA: O-antigen ligase family protein [Solirubrobacteraceae bacterium]|nr:O-antigen ligase family protein [Solirubrobacteraceae bacterium]
MLTFATLSGPLPKVGIVMLALLAAGALLARGPRERALSVAGALVLAPALLLADIWQSPQLSVVHRHPLPALAAAAVALGLLVLAARALADRPALVAPLAVVALPFRIPISVGGATSNLLVPLYLVVGAGALAMVLRGLRANAVSPASGRGAVRVLEGLLALVIVLYAVQSVYSPYFEKALQQTVFFYVPFTLLFCLLRELDWDGRLVGRCLRAVVALAIVFALLGFVEYGTKTLLLNPKLIAANDVHAYFTVNSVFFDPDIFGRFLAIVMIALAGLLLRERERREELGLIGLLAVLWCGLVLTLSRSSLAALLVGLGVLAALRWRVRAILPVVAGVVVVGAIALAATPKTFGLNTGLNNASSGRANLVTGGLDMFGQRPLWGYGSGSFVRQYRNEHPTTAQTLAASHTIPITIAAEQGLIGELPYIALVVAAIAVLLSGAREDPIRAGLAAAFIALVFHTVLYADFLEDPVTWTLLGAGVAMARDRRALQPVGVSRSPSMASVASARPAPAAS